MDRSSDALARAGAASGTAEGRLPTFLVIGAQKAATTSLIHALANHPDVFALPREVHFFDRSYDRGLDWYRQRFAGAATEVAVGESSPSYMYLPETLPRIARDLPGVRLVAILRHPVDRAYSHYWHNRTRAQEPLSFGEAVAAEADRLTADDPRTRARYAYVDRGMYLEQLDRVCRTFPRESLRVVLFDDFRENQEAVVRSISRFVGVDDRPGGPRAPMAKNRFVTFRFQKLRGSIRRLPGPLRRVATRLNVRYSSYPPMPPQVRAELLERFAEPNEALAAWLGRDLTAWSK